MPSDLTRAQREAVDKLASGFYKSLMERPVGSGKIQAASKWVYFDIAADDIAALQRHGYLDDQLKLTPRGRGEGDG